MPKILIMPKKNELTTDEIYKSLESKSTGDQILILQFLQKLLKAKEDSAKDELDLLKKINDK